MDAHPFAGTPAPVHRLKNKGHEHRVLLSDQFRFLFSREGLDGPLSFHGRCAVRLRLDIYQFHRNTHARVM